MYLRNTFGGCGHDRSNTQISSSTATKRSNRSRRAQMWVAASSVMALMLMGASPALAEGEADGGAPTAVVEQSAPAAPAAAPADPPPAPPIETAPPAEQPPVEQPPSAPPVSENGGAESGAGASNGTSDADIDHSDSNNDGGVAADTEAAPQTAAERTLVPTSEVEPPYLRWLVVDQQGAAVASTTFSVQGPRDEGVADDGADAPWLSGLLATVTDNTGEKGYAGLDLDPAPGVFLVKQLIDDSDATVMHDVATGEAYRVRPAEAPGDFALNDDAQWSEIAVTDSADASPLAITLEPAGGMVIARVPNPPSGGAVINVNLRTLRGGGVAATQGIQFRLYTDTSGGSVGSSYNSPGTALSESWATCTTDTDGDCSFTVPSGSNRLGSRYWAVPVSLTGSGSFLSDYFVTGDNTNSGSNRFAMTLYTFRTPVINASITPYQLPGSGLSNMPTRSRVGNPTAPPLGLTTDTSNRWTHNANDMVASLNNNRFTPTCNVPPKIALVVDLSTSMVSPDSTGLNGVKAASTAFANALVNKGATLGIVTFGSNANGQLFTPALVTNSNIGNIRDSIDDMEVSGTQYTNWDRGLAQVSGDNYDVIIVLTDGNPTRYGNGQGSGSWTDMQRMEESIFSANQLKTEGSQLMAFGVGAFLSASMPQNLQAVTGTTAWSGSGSIANIDYAVTSNWTTVASQLANFASSLTCTATVQVKKQERALGGNLSNGQGWTFTPTKTGSGTMSPTGAQTTGSSGLLPNPWTLTFTSTSQTANLTIAETQDRSEFEFESVSCANNDEPMSGIANNPSFALNGLKIGENVVCTVINREVQKEASLSAVKTWIITDGTGQQLLRIHDPAQPGDGTLPTGISAALSATGPAPAGATALAWGEARGGYKVSDQVTISETVTIPAALPGCAVTSQQLTEVNGVATDVDLKDASHVLTIAAISPTTSPVNLNEIEVTNTLKCTSKLSLLKSVQGGDATPDGWQLTAAGPGGPFTATGADAIVAGNTFEVTAGSGYALSEAIGAGGAITYLLEQVERCTSLAPGGGACTIWAPVADVSAVSVELGTHEVYQFVNKPAPAVAMPLTGGLSGDLFGLGGLGALTLATLFGVLYWHRTRRQAGVQ